MITLSCKQCGRSLKVSASNAGKQARCPQCGGVTQVPAESQSPSGGPAFVCPGSAGVRGW